MVFVPEDRTKEGNYSRIMWTDLICEVVLNGLPLKNRSDVKVNLRMLIFVQALLFS
jgi:hypothetical protein